MSLELAIKENTTAIRELIAAMANGQSATAAQVQAVVKQLPETKVAKPTPAAKAEPLPAPLPDINSDDVAFEDATTVSYEETSKSIVKLSRERGREKAIACLADFGVTNLKQAKPEHYAAIQSAANSALVA